MLYVSDESLILRMKLVLHCILTNWNLNENMQKRENLCVEVLRMSWTKLGSQGQGPQQENMVPGQLE